MATQQSQIRVTPTITATSGLSNTAGLFIVENNNLGLNWNHNGEGKSLYYY